jgi:hypothetical protein
VKRPTSAAVAVALLIGAGCGGDEAAISESGAVLLQTQVTDARTAVARGEYARADELLDGIGASVAQLQQHDELADARADDISAALHEVRTALVGVAATTTTVAAPPPSTTRPTTAPPATEHDERGRDKSDRDRDTGDDDNEGEEND